MRRRTELDYLAIKGAFRALVDRVGGIDAAAAASRVGRTTISDYGNADRVDTFARADVVVDLEHAAGAPVVTAEQARLAGYALVPMDAATRAEPLSPLTQIASISKELGEYAAAAMNSLADGMLSAVDLVQMEKEASDVIDAGVRARLAIQAERLRRKGIGE